MATRQILQTDWKGFLFFLQPTQGWWAQGWFLPQSSSNDGGTYGCFPGIFPVLFFLETEKSVSKIATQLLCCKFSPEKKTAFAPAFV